MDNGAADQLWQRTESPDESGNFYESYHSAVQSLHSNSSSMHESIDSIPPMPSSTPPIPIQYPITVLEPPSPPHRPFPKSPSSSLLLESEIVDGREHEVSAQFRSNWGAATIMSVNEFEDVLAKKDDEFPFRDIKVSRRKQLNAKIRNSYPDRFPIILGVKQRSKFTLTKEKFLVPYDMTYGAFMVEVRRHMDDLHPSEALFMYVRGKGVIPAASQLMQNVYHIHKDEEDGFLYLLVCEENVFGCV